MNLLHRTVGPEPTAQYATITEAIQSLPWDGEAVIDIAPGVYEEKVFCDKRSVYLRGAGMDQTILRWADGAYKPHPDGRKTGTFRSYTLFLGGERVRVSDLTVENRAGPGDEAGQGLAVYADADWILMENVRLLGRQDTLFLAPLPEREREPDGFRGPRVYGARRQTGQCYRRCEISGTVDFIFGGGDAVFIDCQLISVNENKAVNGYVTAPSGGPEGLGLVFRRCCLCSDAAAGTVYLGRPWRPCGKAAFLRCELGAHIAPDGWDDWQEERNRSTARFCEYDNRGPGSAGPRPAWIRQLSAEEAEEREARAEELCRSVERRMGEMLF